MALTSKIAFTGYDASHADAVVAASSEDAAFPAIDLLHPALSRPWRSDGALSAVTIDVDLGAATDVDAFILEGTNLTDAADARLTASLLSQSGTEVDDSGTVDAFDLSVVVPRGWAPPLGRAVIYLPAATVSARYYRWTLTDAANPAGYLQARLLTGGAIKQPTVNYAENRQAMTRFAGEPGFDLTRRGWRLTLHRLSRAEAAWFQDLSDDLGAAGRLFAIPHPQEPETWVREAGLYRLAEPIRPAPVTRDLRYWSADLALEEAED